MSEPPDAPGDADFREQVIAHLRAHLDPLLAGRLADVCVALREANRQVNLTGITDSRGMALRHVLDSLTALPLLPETGTLVDLGSGGGLPGLPLALARPDLSVVLIESRARKAAALASLVESLQLGDRVSAVHARGEVWLAENAVDAVVARAAAPLPDLLATLAPVRRQTGRLIVLHGPSADEELVALGPRLARLGWRPPERHEASLPEAAGRRVLLVFRPESPGG